MTLQEYFQTPESLLPTELAYGVLRVADAPFTYHQRAVFDFALALDAHVRELGLGEVWLAPTDVILDAERALVVQPDLLFVSKERGHLVRERIYGAPDLVLEVLSPNPRVGRTEERLGWFARYGVRECWIYRQPDRQLEVVSFDDGRIAGRRSFGRLARIESAVLPAFDRTVDAIVRL